MPHKKRRLANLAINLSLIVAGSIGTLLFLEFATRAIGVSIGDIVGRHYPVGLENQALGVSTSGRSSTDW